MNKLIDITLLLASARALEIEDRQPWHDEVDVTVERGGQKQTMHFRGEEWDEMHGDQIFNLSWLGSMGNDDYWQDIADESFREKADPDDPAAFDNQLAVPTYDPNNPLQCVPEQGTCRPQCPTAEWNSRRKYVEFSWIEDVEGCEFMPLSTYMILTPLIDGKLPDRPIEDYTAVVLPMTRPKPDPVKVYKRQIFEDNPNVSLESGVEYFVSALYLKDIG